MSLPDPHLVGVAIAKRTGERRLLTLEEYLVLDDSSEARWEFCALDADPRTGEPLAAELEQFGFTPGGPKRIPGNYIEVEPGWFLESTQADTNPRE